MTERVDVAIVGGGPAGAIIARRLALAGWRVMLLERGAAFRRKTCGHCLSPRARRLLADQGLLEQTLQVAEGTTRMLRVHGERGLHMRVAISAEDESAGLVVPREPFDQMLRGAAAAAGAEVLQSATARIRALNAEDATLRVTMNARTMDVRCRLLVGADGVGSSVARAAGLAGAESPGRKYGLALDVTDGDADDAIAPGAIEMFIVPGGYVGIVRLNSGGFHVAALVDAQHSSAPRDPIDFLQKAAEIHPALSFLHHSRIAKAGSHRISAVGPMPWQTRGVTNGCVALIGDAAGYVEPFTGEGIAWAIHSAALLGSAISSAGGAWNQVAADMYAEMWRREIHQRQRLCRWVTGVLERPLASRLLLRAGVVAPGLSQRLVRQVVAA